MRTIVVLLVAVGLASAIPSTKHHPLSDKFIAEINSKQSLWKAGRNFDVDQYEFVKTLASGVKKPNATKPLKVVVHDELEDVPESFNSRENWSECADIIGLIRDQSKCGSCWAFAAVEAMSDRICIHSEAKRKILVSSQDLLTCGNAGGCDGGWPTAAWSTWNSDGIVTGGLYEETSQGCKAYFLPTCDDHPHKCRDYVDTPACVESCDDSSVSYDDQKTYGQEPYNLGLAGVKQIQLEIYKNGPVETDFTVYEDFLNYKSGIYQYTQGEALGGHAVKMVGWGVEDGVDYWIIANSWNEKWGEDGYFRIVRGNDEVGIESDIVAGLPDFDRF